MVSGRAFSAFRARSRVLSSSYSLTRFLAKTLVHRVPKGGTPCKGSTRVESPAEDGVSRIVSPSAAVGAPNTLIVFDRLEDFSGVFSCLLLDMTTDASSRSFQREFDASGLKTTREVLRGWRIWLGVRIVITPFNPRIWAPSGCLRASFLVLPPVVCKSVVSRYKIRVHPHHRPLPPSRKLQTTCDVDEFQVG